MSDTFFVNTSNEEQVDNSTNQVENQEQPFLTVGDRVFKTKEDVVKNISSAQEHISKIENSYKEAISLIEKQEGALEKSSRIEELMEALAKRKEESSGRAEETPSLNKDDLIADAIKAFDQLQNERKSVEVEQRNWEEATSILSKAYADKTDEVVRKVVAENDLTWEDAVRLAKRSPKVFLKMFNLNNKTTATVNTSSVNTEQFGTQRASKPHTSLMKMSTRERAEYVRQRLADFKD
jgi:YesN/AraC family two-component response regulator